MLPQVVSLTNFHRRVADNTEKTKEKLSGLCSRRFERKPRKLLVNGDNLRYVNIGNEEVEEFVLKLNV